MTSHLDFPHEDNPSKLLHDQVTSRLVLERAHFKREWERHDRLGNQLATDDGNLNKLFQSLNAEANQPLNSQFVDLRERIETSPPIQASTQQVVKTGHSFSNGLNSQLGIMNAISTPWRDRITFRGIPFDTDWAYCKPDEANLLGDYGSGDARTGLLGTRMAESYVSGPVAYGGWIRAAGGVGVWFKPKAPHTYIRVSPFINYDYIWSSDSTLQVAHNFGEINTTVTRYVSPGNFETITERKISLWRDGTSWYETHGDSNAGTLANSDYFFGSSNDWYLIWVWCSGGVDFATKTTFSSSRAQQWMNARVGWFVFEQWT
jgi:hypothetical protein